jgi:hypothetical protein
MVAPSNPHTPSSKPKPSILKFFRHLKNRPKPLKLDFLKITKYLKTSSYKPNDTKRVGNKARSKTQNHDLTDSHEKEKNRSGIIILYNIL